MNNFNKKLNELSYDTLKYIILDYGEIDISFKKFVETHFSNDDTRIEELNTFFDDIDIFNDEITTDILTSYFKDIKALVTDPYIAIDLIMKFFLHEDALFQLLPCADDYYIDPINDFYNVEVLDWDHYSYIAGNLFVEYAIKSNDSTFIINSILELWELDRFRAREIISESNKYFNSNEIRILYNIIENKIDKNDRFDYEALLSLSKHIPDGALFKKNAIASNYLNISTKDVVSVYIAEKKYNEALSLLDFNLLTNDTVRNYQLLEAFKGLNDKASLKIVAKHIFTFSSSIESLNKISKYVEKDIRVELINIGISEIISGKSSLNIIDRVKFLISIDKEKSENYIASNYDIISILGDKEIVLLIELLLTNKAYLPVIFIYRKTILDILEFRRNSKYALAATYLITLENLTKKIIDWKSYNPHSIFFEDLKSKYSARRKFWSEYEK